MKLFSYCLVVLILACAASAAPPSGSVPAGAELSDRAGDAAAQALIDEVLSCHTMSRRRLSTELAGASDAECSLREFVVSTLSLGKLESLGRTIRREAKIPTARINSFLTELATRDPYRLNVRSLQLTTQPAELIATGEVSADDSPFDDHLGWRYCRRQSILIARRAAAEDFRARLLNTIVELPVSLKATLGETLGQNADAGRAVRDEIDKLSLPEANLDVSGVCRIRLVLPKKQVIALLRSALENLSAEKVAVDWPRLSSKLSGSVAVEGFSVAPPPETSSRTSRPSEN